MGNADCIERVYLAIEMFNNDTVSNNLKPAYFIID